MKIETLAVHAGHNIDSATGAVVSPIYLSTTFERQPDGSYPQGYNYSRDNNPNRDSLEKCLSKLEGGAAAAAFSSGSAATLSIFQALSPGDHVVAPLDSYTGTGFLLREIFGPWNLEVTFVDMANPTTVMEAVQPNTKLIWIETPSNPMLRITDISKIAHIANQHNVYCVCDNTWATPISQRPLELGADLVIHSTTKYLGGHSDVLGGAVITKVKDEFFHKIKTIQMAGGSVAAPFDCWLLLRSIQTLPYRMRAHSENALKVARFLEEHSQVEAVHYPGLPNHPGHGIAAAQMNLFGGMISFQVKGNREDAFAFTGKVKVFTRATSLGGVESLVEHRASMEFPGTRTPDNLLRMSVGLEHTDDLLEDLTQALG
ncbi:MAG: aminotransferase class I/II-fold pyridoxal phosphate-dependent enzyme [Moorea sp. SIO1F2]|uniref:trans-sulfuration enzyme family protein n=1 Tax=Moorena sp. SIO1F2 TaxID=2607819 RepID=UPI0013B8AFE0|nr:aminotransferase class I/II-fold pyridoxal phosphate-dependent enzyme [Moorena sp. SIO1F2]NET85727.1 aminotransferase class I/II-fold pyridoxal phosphate-dependent enzyme [Moorena sp. SIO1F2]